MSTNNVAGVSTPPDDTHMPDADNASIIVQLGDLKPSSPLWPLVLGFDPLEVETMIKGSLEAANRNHHIPATPPANSDVDDESEEGEGEGDEDHILLDAAPLASSASFSSEATPSVTPKAGAVEVLKAPVIETPLPLLEMPLSRPFDLQHRPATIKYGRNSPRKSHAGISKSQPASPSSPRSSPRKRSAAALEAAAALQVHSASEDAPTPETASSPKAAPAMRQGISKSPRK